MTDPDISVHEAEYSQSVRNVCETTIITYINTSEQGYSQTDPQKAYKVTIDTCLYAKLSKKEASQYIAWVAEQVFIESNNQIIVDESRLYGETQAHKYGLMTRLSYIVEHCTVADIIIYSDGSIYDGRPEVDVPAVFLSWFY